MRTLVFFSFGAAVLVAASCGARTPFDESEVAGVGGATSGGATGTNAAATTSGTGTGDTVGTGTSSTSGTGTGDSVAATTTGPFSGTSTSSSTGVSSTFAATSTGGGSPGAGGAFGTGGVSTSTGTGGVSTSTGAGGVFAATTGIGTGGPAGAAGRGGTGGFGGFAGGFGRDGGVVVDAGRVDASGPNPLIGILPGVRQTPQCNQCVDTRCNGSSACASDPTCLGGVSCYFASCAMLTNQGQQIACALKCFNGNVALAIQGSNAVNCIYGTCGPSCVGRRGGGRGPGAGG